MSQDEFLSTDEAFLDQVIADYLRAEAVGQAGDLQQWFDRYPTCAAGLMEFCEDRARVGRLVMPAPSQNLAEPIDHDSTGVFKPFPPIVAEADTVDFRLRPPQLPTARFHPLRFHARGGMGEIWLTHDQQIGRQVAVKKLRSGRESQHARFVIEAQITGQLEHPSIVPLHDLGIDDVGQPYYVMKFIHGRKFGEVIAEFHGRRKSPDWTRNLEFRRLLETFVDVCNVVAYAHSKGVLHRDIKPDNVMLGPYGETLVVDWGLAKVLSEPDEPADQYVQLSGSACTETQDGSIVGSPFYMSPEGAEGCAEAIDKLSDVYLLGATLYEIITAKRPRDGSSQLELIDLARNSRPKLPRSLEPHLPPALESVCMKAMAFHKQKRYASALELADEVQRFLAGEPTSSYAEPLITRIGRWLHRHRHGIVRGLTAACIFTLFGLTVVGFRQARVVSDRERARSQLAEYRRLVDDALFFAANTDSLAERMPYYDPGRAKAVGTAALAISGPWGQHAEGLPLADQRASVVEQQYALLLSLSQIHLRADSSAAEVREALALLNQAESIRQPSRSYFELRSRCYALLGEVEMAQREAKYASHPDTAVTPNDHFLQGEMLRSLDIGTSAQAVAAASALRRAHLAEAAEAFNRALRLDPQHFWARFQLGRCLLALGRHSEAVETLGACVAMRPESPWALSARGLAQLLAARPKEALADLDAALELDPEFQPARLNRGIVLWLTNDNAATQEFDAVMAAPADKRLVEAAFYRGQCYLGNRQYREALADFSMVLADRPQLRAAHWFRAQARLELGDVQNGFADLTTFVTDAADPADSADRRDIHLAMGKALRKMAGPFTGEVRTELLQRAAEELHTAAQLPEPSAEIFAHLGAVYELLGDVPKAIECYSDGINLGTDQVALYNLRGWIYSGQQQPDSARADFAEALRLAPDSAEAHTGLGFVSAQMGHSDEARREATAGMLAGSDNYLVLHNVACIYGQLSQLEPQRRTEYENLALAMLKSATSIARDRPVEGAGVLALMRQETAFPHSLRSRPEFQELLLGP